MSYALHGLPGVSESVRKHILDTADALGFVRPELHPTSHRIIGLILSDIANPFYPEISVAFTEAARRRGYEVFLAHTKDDEESVAEALDAMLDRHVDGVAMTVARSDTAEAVRRLRRAHVPLVQISRSFSGVDADFVGIDDDAAGRAMMRHVLEHRPDQIGIVVGPRTSSASAAREAAFIDEARAAGIAIDPRRRVNAPLTIAGGRMAAEHLLGLERPPTFIVCGSDVLALGAMSLALAMGLDVPGNVAVSGFDGIELAATPMIDLTGVVQPRRTMASRAVELLIDRVERTTHHPTRLTVPFSLRIGRSCGCQTTPTDKRNSP
ncbi:LacI family DNA-binding transcriptional regulator [Microbacterium trichothecenolyticum]|uniref:LacI family DNA-binding transcriptional regulator n=1 Tax=Microbacterium ureisolvens TaxID=2781186 RepID=A0ABS7I032_9MICO|nr:LacI family DNA-binding transcriptional regulator [Microbacterium ureisolvens]MBW9120569.1 LacI family DNA-binding transcriptional regulator [Microbacterium trichothecenolyticum]